MRKKHIILIAAIFTLCVLLFALFILIKKQKNNLKEAIYIYTADISITGYKGYTGFNIDIVTVGDELHDLVENKELRCILYHNGLEKTVEYNECNIRENKKCYESSLYIEMKEEAGLYAYDKVALFKGDKLIAEREIELDIEILEGTNDEKIMVETVNHELEFGQYCVSVLVSNTSEDDITIIDMNNPYKEETTNIRYMRNVRNKSSIIISDDTMTKYETPLVIPAGEDIYIEYVIDYKRMAQRYTTYIFSPKFKIKNSVTNEEKEIAYLANVVLYGYIDFSDEQLEMYIKARELE